MIARNFRRLIGAALLGLAGLGTIEAADAPADLAITFSAKDTTGHSYLAIEPGAKATVWIFISHDCPISNGYAQEIGRIRKKYSATGVSFRIAYAESGSSAAGLAAHAAQYGYTPPLFRDEALAAAKACGVTVTPEVVVLDASGKPVYRGRIDDRYWAPGRERAQVNRQGLREALDDVLSGRTVNVARTTPVGCYLTLP